MIKQQINSLEITVGSVGYGESVLPLSYPSVSSALAAEGVFYGTNISSYTPPRSAVLSGDIEVSALVLSYSKVELKLTNVGAPSVIEINGHKVGTTVSYNRVYTFDVKNYLHIGKNRLTIYLDGAEFVPTEYRLTAISLGSCEIIAYNHALVGTVSMKQQMLDGKVRLDISLDSFDALSGVRAVATLVSPGGRVYFCGMSGGKGTIDISEPNLWWPRGLGVQNLYKLTVNLYYDNEIIDSKDVKLGLVNYQAIEGGPVPVFEVNGVPVLNRGACYLPDNALLPMLDKERTRSLIFTARSLGFNTIAVRDVGVYPGELFYSLCDEAGMLVWQEISCDGNVEEKKRELIDNLVPMAIHPSLALLIYTGNGQSCELRSLFHDVCSVTLDSFDTLITDPSATIPKLSTLSKFVPPSDMNIFSPTLEKHTTLKDNASMISSAHYRFPCGISELAYVTALRARDEVREKINNIRRSGSLEKHILLSRLTDPVPMISPSVTDSLGCMKGYSYSLAGLFEDIYIGAVNDGTRVTFFVSNESKTEYNGRFGYTVYDRDGKTVFRDGFDITAPLLTSVDILTVDLAEVVGDRLDECFVYYRLSDSFLTTSMGTLFFVPSKAFKYAPPDIKTELSGSGTEFVLTVGADKYAAGVYVDLPNIDASLSDNLFDIVDGGAKRVEIKTAHAVAIEVLRRELKVITLYDLGRN